MVKTSPNGGVILTGAGIAAVRKRIEEAFSSVRADVSTSEPEIEIVEEVQTDIKSNPAPDNSSPPIAERPLAERAEAILRVAEQRFQHAVGRRHHHPNVYIVTIPTKTAQELFDAALKSLRHRVVEDK